MSIFVSYASEQRETAGEIALALREEGHEVFHDRSTLPEGDAYNAAIREAIEACNLFVFLVSPEAVTPGRYTLTELGFAEAKWASPSGHVLPVVVRPTDAAAIPAYLRAVTILRPTGNVPAEVVAAVVRLSRPRWVRFVRRYAALILVVAALGAGWGVWRGYGHWRACGDAKRHVREAELQKRGGDYSAAWDRYADAFVACPGSDEVILGRERLAMEWLDDIRVTVGKETFTDIVNKVQPALSRGAVASDDRRAANALAHLGWADFLRGRDGAGGLNPVRYYRQSIERDAKNPFAHAMWGHYIMWDGGSPGDAGAHFSAAESSGLERPYVRRMELHAFLLRNNDGGDFAALRIVNDMRAHGERLVEGTDLESLMSKLRWIYERNLSRGNDRSAFLRTLPPGDHLATFRWVYPEDSLSESDSRRPQYLLFLAQLQENAGDRAGALASYESLLRIVGGDPHASRMATEAAAAVKRLKAG